MYCKFNTTIMGQNFSLPFLTNPLQPADMARRPESLDIIIVGAGLGGLAASIECARSGHNVTMLESASELAEVGSTSPFSPENDQG